MTLKPYSVHSGSAGPIEGAGLVFAHSVREARKEGWRCFAWDFLTDYLDTAATLIRDQPWLMSEAIPGKLLIGEAHGVFPKCCSDCGFWGQSQIGEDGLCEACRDYNKMMQNYLRNSIATP